MIARCTPPETREGDADDSNAKGPEARTTPRVEDDLALVLETIARLDELKGVADGGPSWRRNRRRHASVQLTRLSLT